MKNKSERVITALEGFVNGAARVCTTVKNSLVNGIKGAGRGIMRVVKVFYKPKKTQQRLIGQIKMLEHKS